LLTVRGHYNQSQACQRKDWHTHKFNCSLLPPDGLSPAQFEDGEREELGAEAGRVSGLLIQWMKAFSARKEQGGKENKINAGRLQEARAIAELDISPRFQYARLPQHHDKAPFRTPLILATRLLFMDLIASMSPEDLTKFAKSLETASPSQWPQLYGPKMAARPGDLSPGEYEMLSQVLLIYTLEDPRAKLDKDRWISLALSMKKLFGIQHSTKKSWGGTKLVGFR